MAKVALSLPTLTGERLGLLAPLITPRVVELAHWRIRVSENFFNKEKLIVPDDKETVKVALLLAHIMNPYEDFSEEEEALMRGVTSKTLRARKAQKEVRPL